MKYKELLDLKKRMEFNKTEPETVQELVSEAIEKGNKARKNNERLSRLSSQITQELEKIDFILTSSLLEDIKYDSCAVGIDGSFQTVGGTGGSWYSPFCVVRILFESGLEATPTVDVITAGIEEIKEQHFRNVDFEASVRMMVGETKALLSWGAKNKEAVVFIDGPIVDPPTYRDKTYIKDRSEAICRCYDHCLLIGCVKRSRDTFLLDYLKEEDTIKSSLEDFPSDQHLMLYVFNKFREKRNYLGPLFTSPIDLSEKSIYKQYKDHDVFIATSFYQKEIGGRVLRLDVPFSVSLEEVDKEGMMQIKRAVKNATDWTYPAQDVPMPVKLADEKCKVREGFAKVLHEEILTKGRSSNRFSQIISESLR